LLLLVSEKLKQFGFNVANSNEEKIDRFAKRIKTFELGYEDGLLVDAKLAAFALWTS
jgi:hypothetical protein